MRADRNQARNTRANQKRSGCAGGVIKGFFGFFIKTVAVLLMLGIIGGCIGACWLTMYVFEKIDAEEKIEMDLDILKMNYTTIVYAEDEKGDTYELQRLVSSEGSRIWVDFDQMPQHLLDTLVAVEDKRFWSHPGVDWQRTFLSFVNLVGQKFGFSLYEGTPGASTITQQLVRNITEDKDVSVARKLREIFRAINLEKHYSKDQILETYLNTVTFGNNTYGIQAAANLYFDKDVSELTVAECASIIGITKDPTYYNPYYRYENNQNRKEDILYLMREQNLISNREYEEAMAQKIVFNERNNEKRQSTVQSYFVDYMMEQVIEDLVAQTNCTQEEAKRNLYRGGYRIYTTIDESVQNKLEEIYENYEETFPKVSNKDEYPQSAFIITDTHGAIKGIVGGTGKKEGALIWNRATDTKRQPGSTIKPISSYAMAFENNLVTWSSLLLDGPFYYGTGQETWEPTNHYSGFKGYMILEEALQRSTNMIPVRLVEQLTPKVCWDFMHDRLQINSLVESDIALSPMSLGALTYGVSPLEMAGAYQIFANGGTYTKPYTYTQVLDSNGNVILKRNTTPIRVLSAEDAAIINKLLQRVVTGPYGTGTRASLASTNPGIPVAGKTGTTDKDVDQWFIGITPYYVGVCWMGFDEPTTTNANGVKVAHSIGYSGLPYPPPLLWKTVMSKVHEGLPAKDFSYSAEVVSLTYCLDTGYIASPYCINTSTGWYKTSNIPTTCPVHANFTGEDTSSIPLAGSMPSSLAAEMTARQQAKASGQTFDKNAFDQYYAQVEAYEKQQQEYQQQMLSQLQNESSTVPAEDDLDAYLERRRRRNGY